MVRIKICGLKEAVHVQAAVEAGADAIGFVFAPSSRQVSIPLARKLASYVPAPIKKVGVFVNASIEEINAAVKTVPLDYVQLHGDEPDTLMEAITVPVIKAFSIQSKQDVANVLSSPAPLVLVDAPGTAFRGGSGHTFDWSYVIDLVTHRPFILAGGLNPENVAQAIREVQPVMVDVSSGVETDGRKDVDKIKAFIQAVREVTP